MFIRTDDLVLTAARALDARISDVKVESTTREPDHKQIITVHNPWHCVVAIPAEDLGDSLPEAKRVLWTRIQCELADCEADAMDLDIMDEMTEPDGTIHTIYGHRGEPRMTGIVVPEIGTRYTMELVA